MLELVIFMGLPGAGKSGFYRARFAGTHAHISKDLLRNARNKQAREIVLIEQMLGQGKSVVVDDTNATIEHRVRLIQAGRRFGARMIGYHFDAEVAECLHRNAQRQGRARVPEVAIYATARKFVPPTRAEGFDELFRVRLSLGDFVVEAVRE